MLETGSYPYADLADLPAAAAARAEPALLLLLDLVQDPQNVGALLRTAEAMGVHGAILQRRRGCEITPAVVTASAGAVEHLQVAQVTNLVEAMRWLKQQGIWLIGLERGAEARPLETMDLQMPAGLVIGSEGEGLRRLVREQCDFLAQVAMYGRVESLNAAAAGSIALYAARVARKV
jgi:23S rRNA (guanosine2251-2'-O)-methyltransferase